MSLFYLFLSKIRNSKNLDLERLIYKIPFLCIRLRVGDKC